MTTTKVVYACDCDYVAFGALRRELRKVGIKVDKYGEIDETVPRHDYRLVAVVEKYGEDKYDLRVAEIAGDTYKIRQLAWGEEAQEPRNPGYRGPGWIVAE